jgi:hypothetical protein
VNHHWLGATQCAPTVGLWQPELVPTMAVATWFTQGGPDKELGDSDDTPRTTNQETSAMTCGACACAGVHVCMCARVGTIWLNCLRCVPVHLKQLPCRLVDVVHAIVHVCMDACVIGTAVGTILDELSCLRCKQWPCRLVGNLVQIARSPC